MKYRLLFALTAVAAMFSFSACDDSEDTPEPIAHYRFDGDANDDIGGYHGVASSTEFAANLGVSGSAGDFNGIDSRISIASPFDMEEKTISLWFNSKTADEGLRIIYALDHPNLNFGMTIISVEQVGDDLTILFNSSRELFSKSIEADTWYHVALATDGLQYKYFLNGIEVKSGTMVEFISSGNGTTDAMVGCSRAFDRFFYGKLDELKVFDRALTSSEIGALSSEFFK